MEYTLTIFTDRKCDTISRTSNISGKNSKNFQNAMRIHGYSTLDCKTYKELGIRIDSIQE